MAEGLKIAGLLREFVVDVVVAPPYRCASACFFLYVAAASRQATGPPGPGSIVVHRPFPSLAAALTFPAPVLDLLDDLANVQLRQWLAAHDVPPALVTRALETPSTPQYALGQQEIDTLGRRSTDYARWLEARCPGFAADESAYLGAAKAVARAQLRAGYDAAMRCEVAHVDRARRLRQITTAR